MKIVFTIQHPAHVHFFRNAMTKLEREGHEVHVFARDKDIALDLLDEYDIEYTILAGKGGSLARLAMVQLTYEVRMVAAALKIRPDVMMAIGEPAVSHAAKVVGCRSVLFGDTEHAAVSNYLGYPFADTICTPRCYQNNLGDKQVRYPGYHELAYLHPNRFEPSTTVLDRIEANPDDKLAVLRLNEWEALHEVGDSGFSNPAEVVERLEAAGARVFITSEMDLAPELEKRRAQIPYMEMHDLLYYADLFIGESPTMSVEAAVLGTPAVFVATTFPSNVREIEDEYGLVFNYGDENRHKRSIQRAVSILENDDQEQWTNRRQNLLSDTVDTTDVILEQVLE